MRHRRSLKAVLLLLLIVVPAAGAGYLAGSLRTADASRREMENFAVMQINLAVGALLSLEAGNAERARGRVLEGMERSLARMARHEGPDEIAERERFKLNTLRRAAELRSQYPQTSSPKERAKIDRYLSVRLAAGADRARLPTVAGRCSAASKSISTRAPLGSKKNICHCLPSGDLRKS